MNRKRIKQVQDYCHDRTVGVRSSVRNGKSIPNLENIADMWNVLEEMSKAILDERQ